MNELNEFIHISKYVGQRFDLIQAGGGNTSVKMLSGEMHIKASGYALSELSQDKGYVTVDSRGLADRLLSSEIVHDPDKKNREFLCKQLVQESIVDSGLLPSIETALHLLLHQYTCHTHPVAVNVLTCAENWRESLSEHFPTACLVPYATPGIDLAIAMHGEIEKYREVHYKEPKVVFLQNHGLLISSDCPKEVIRLNDEVVVRAEEIVSLDLSDYRLTTSVSSLINSLRNTDLIAYLSCDGDIQNWLNAKRPLDDLVPIFPDKYVFSGVSMVLLENLQDPTPVEDYQKQFFDMPKVVAYKNKLFFMAANVRKAKESEEVFKSHILIKQASSQELQVLSTAEIAYLGSWEAEKYRQRL
jgi:rhamnose utilization protein RhaD (predicted bifunctional aldolase and dehydrogenase)